MPADLSRPSVYCARSSCGCFVLKDTVVALTALSEVTALLPIKDINLDLSLFVPGELSQHIVVNGSNRLINRKVEVGYSFAV